MQWPSTIGEPFTTVQGTSCAALFLLDELLLRRLRTRDAEVRVAEVRDHLHELGLVRIVERRVLADLVRSRRHAMKQALAAPGLQHVGHDAAGVVRREVAVLRLDDRERRTRVVRVLDRVLSCDDVIDAGDHAVAQRVVAVHPPRDRLQHRERPERGRRLRKARRVGREVGQSGRLHCRLACRASTSRCRRWRDRRWSAQRVPHPSSAAATAASDLLHRHLHRISEECRARGLICTSYCLRKSAAGRTVDG